MGRVVCRAALLPVVLLLAACARTPVVEVGEPAPEVRLADASGREMSLGELKGQVVLLNFWALWCEPCKAELPEFQESLERYGPDGLRVVTVNLGDPVEDVQAYLTGKGYSFVTLVDPKLSLRKSYDTRILPLNILIDREGVVAYLRVTPFEPGDLAARVEALLGASVAQVTAEPGSGTREAPPTASPTHQPSEVPSPTASATASPAPTKAPDTATVSPSPTLTATPSRTATRTPTATPTRTPVPSATATPTASHTPTPTSTPVPSATATPTPSITPSPTPTQPAATATPSPSPSPSPTANATAVPPTATETSVPPVYGVTLSGESYKTVYPNEWVELVADLANTGNVEDTYLVGLQIQPRGWEAKYCIGPACYDYSVPSMPVTVPAGSHQQVSVKLKPPDDAPAGQTRSGNLRVASQSDPSVTAGLGVTAEVITP